MNLWNFTEVWFVLWKVWFIGVGWKGEVMNFITIKVMLIIIEIREKAFLGFDAKKFSFLPTFWCLNINRQISGILEKFYILRNSLKVCFLLLSMRLKPTNCNQRNCNKLHLHFNLDIIWKEAKTKLSIWIDISLIVYTLHFHLDSFSLPINHKTIIIWAVRRPFWLTFKLQFKQISFLESF